MENLLNYQLNILDEIKILVQKIDNEEYTAKIQVLNGSTLGQHIRHIVEFYICLFAGNKTVNYENRDRNLLIENSPVYSLQVIDEIKHNLLSSDISQEVNFIQTIGDLEVNLKSNIARELIYLSEHTIHHFALIKIGFNAICPHKFLPEDFGVADSTKKYRESKLAESCAS
ncbi:hypothetical protein [Lacihabitans sp. LS3-19]|uniref:hypothetical protein n=1 Tax=Lacihabitans sp. LS3-19 TaxID=2487335 RepID=UPI0020CFA5D6|nr:hypothetical protein [Lacihabitans sp. LS3-19]